MRLPETVIVILLLSAFIACVPKQKNTVALEQGISDLIELRTYEQVYHAVGYINREQTILFFKTIDRELLYSIDIRVHAGIDVHKGVHIVSAGGYSGRVVVSLPPPEILLVDADESTIHQYFSRGHGISLLEYGDQVAALKGKIEQEAIARGILRRAEENARLIVRSFLQQAGVHEIVFTPARVTG